MSDRQMSEAITASFTPTAPTPRDVRCDWRIDQRCQHTLGHDGPHMVMPLKPFDFMAPDGSPYPALTRREPLDVERLAKSAEHIGLKMALEWWEAIATEYARLEAADKS